MIFKGGLILYIKFDSFVQFYSVVLGKKSSLMLSLVNDGKCSEFLEFISLHCCLHFEFCFFVSFK